jgi:hypothetical protein
VSAFGATNDRRVAIAQNEAMSRKYPVREFRPKDGPQLRRMSTLLITSCTGSSPPCAGSYLFRLHRTETCSPILAR